MGNPTGSKDGLSHSKYKIYKFIVDGQPIGYQYLSNDTLYKRAFSSSVDINEWVGNREHAYVRTDELMN